MKAKAYCIFSAQYLPNIGGVERYTYNLAKKLIETGNSVTVVTSNFLHLKDYELSEGIHVYRMPCYDLLDGRYPVIRPDRNFRAIHRELKKKSFDMVIVNTRFYTHSVYGQWFAKKTGTKVITIDHGSSHLSVGNPALDFAGGIYEHMITKAGQLFCKDYYGVSSACVQWLKHFHIKAKGILYNSVDVDAIENVLSKKEKSFCASYGIDDEAVVITYTGRLLPEKGIPQLLKAFKEVQKTYENTYLFLAGGGVLDSLVNAQKNEHIIPLGRIALEDVLFLLDESDIFCLPSFSEGFSTSILEAIVCKCYVVTTARGGAKETFPTDEYGMVIKNNEVELLTEALKKSVSSPGIRVKAAEKAYERLRKNFTWDIVAAKISRLTGQA